MADEKGGINKDNREGYQAMPDRMRAEVDRIEGEKNRLVAQANTPEGYYLANKGLNDLYHQIDSFNGLRGELLTIHEDIKKEFDIKTTDLTTETIKDLSPDQQGIVQDYLDIVGYVEGLKKEIGEISWKMEPPKDLMIYAEERFDNIVDSLNTYKDYADKKNADPKTLRAFATQIDEDMNFLYWLSTFHVTPGHRDYKLPDEKQERIHTEIIRALEKYKKLFSL